MRNEVFLLIAKLGCTLRWGWVVSVSAHLVVRLPGNDMGGRSGNESLSDTTLKKQNWDASDSVAQDCQ
ncbi:MAG: hypothetical protein EBE86_002945 [Hormoscilla sp. GUM202]|nr:hypothetical protein [Hormoscilla sp. GUM202]